MGELTVMGRILLVFRLVRSDLRRHPGQAAMLLLSLTVATGMLALGGATETLYRHTRAATAGPDVVAVSPDDSAAAAHTQAALTSDPAVAAHSGPYLQYYSKLSAKGSTSHVVVMSADTEPGTVDRPLVTSGTWVRSGGVVVERGFATALGVHVGDHVTVAGRSMPVVGTAVSAATTVYPFAQLTGPAGGPSDYSGLVWMSEPDTRALSSKHLPAASLLYLKLHDPDATRTFLNAHRGPSVYATFFSWQFMIVQDGSIIVGTQPILVIGSWLLSFLAIAGVATLAAGRAAKQTRRVGLLKAVGATPGLIAAVLLSEYVALALIADVLGLLAARFTQPIVVNPTASLLTTSAGPSGGVITITTVVALAVALLTTLGPALRAMRTETVAALSDAARQPDQRARLTRLAAMLPVPVLLGLRLIARRPGRAFLQACSITATVITITALLMIFVQRQVSYGIDSPRLGNLEDAQSRHMIIAVAAALVTLAAVNTLTTTWTTALEARHTMAVARTLGATPGQVTAGLSAAQLLPSVPGAVVGIPLGIAFCWPFSHAGTIYPPAWWLFAGASATVLVTAACTALPARTAAHRSVAQTLSAETT
ncbi:ABC transporter permease [Streptomyces shenzhenensis]|uniref:ABC transporter permease n=1 Tax=Streptomyces shenzhenensis TaxID=943815 RepID=UPI001F2BBF1C|nr:ABC transporter permease [Streptomyces shenzhenensis]